MSDENESLETSNNSRVSWLKDLLSRVRPSNTNILENAIDDYIDELKETQQDEASADNQKTLIKNVLKTHDLTVADVMVPRADIIAIEENASLDDLKRIFSVRPYSRIPVYREILDQIIGVVHIKDIFAQLLTHKPFSLAELMREPLVASSSMPLMDLLLIMREDKKHLAVVVDEFGGIDGVVTLNDVMTAIVGDIEDEFDPDNQPKIIEKTDGSLIVDARLDVDEFEERYGNILTADEREDIETLGGLAFSLAGHIPKRGEILKHTSGMILEITDADATKVNRLRLRNLPSRQMSDEV